MYKFLIVLFCCFSSFSIFPADFNGKSEINNNENMEFNNNSKVNNNENIDDSQILSLLRKRKKSENINYGSKVFAPGPILKFQNNCSKHGRLVVKNGMGIFSSYYKDESEDEDDYENEPEGLDEVAVSARDIANIINNVGDRIHCIQIENFNLSYELIEYILFSNDLKNLEYLTLKEIVINAKDVFEDFISVPAKNFISDVKSNLKEIKFSKLKLSKDLTKRILSFERNMESLKKLWLNSVEFEECENVLEILNSAPTENYVNLKEIFFKSPLLKLSQMVDFSAKHFQKESSIKQVNLDYDKFECDFLGIESLDFFHGEIFRGVDWSFNSRDWDHPPGPAFKPKESLPRHVSLAWRSPDRSKLYFLYPAILTFLGK